MSKKKLAAILAVVAALVALAQQYLAAPDASPATPVAADAGAADAGVPQ